MNGLLAGCWAWVLANPLVGVGMAVAAAVMLWKNPRQTLKLVAAVLVLVAVGYAVSAIVDFTMSSVSSTRQLIEPGK